MKSSERPLSADSVESRPSLRLPTQSFVLAKAAIQTLSELNPLSSLEAKISVEQVAEYTKLRLVPDTRQFAVCDQVRPAFNHLGARRPASGGCHKVTRT